MYRLKPGPLLATIAMIGLSSTLLASERRDDTPSTKSTDGAKPQAAKPGKLETATFGGGCFWCLEAVYERIPGVKNVVSGYAGGNVAKPTYKQVCTGRTGHAEVVQLTFDPEQISYEKLLEVFFALHDPTTLNRQGPDYGTQYRSVIFFENEAQRAASQAAIETLGFNGVFRDPIVTQLEPLAKFYPAEAYHQDYYRNNKNAPYCQMTIAPKLQKLHLK